MKRIYQSLENVIKRVISRSASESVKNTIHNFLSYMLSDDEIVALNYGLDQHIP